MTWYISRPVDGCLQMRSAAQADPTEAQVNVIILAGGFNAELVQEITRKMQEDTLSKDSSSSMIRKTVVRSMGVFLSQ